MPVPYAFRSIDVDDNVAEGAAPGELSKTAEMFARLWQGATQGQKRRTGVSVAEDRVFSGSAATAVALR